jgi:hypothetical protein
LPGLGFMPGTGADARRILSRKPGP